MERAHCVVLVVRDCLPFIHNGNNFFLGTFKRPNVALAEDLIKLETILFLVPLSELVLLWLRVYI